MPIPLLFTFHLDGGYVLKKKGILICFVIIFIITTLSSSIMFFGIYAESLDELNEKLAQNQKLIEEKKAKLEQIEKQKTSELAKKQSIDKEIEKTQDEITNLDAILKDVNNQLEEKNNELENSNQEMQDYYESYKERIRANYETSKTTYLEVLFGSKSFSDFIVRYELVSQIMEYDNKLIAQMKDKIASIESLKNQIEQNKNKNNLTKDLKESQEDLYTEQSKKGQQIISNLEKSAKANKALIAELEKLDKETQAEIERLTNKDKKFVGGEFEWPVPGFYYISSPFGMRSRGMHWGVDIASHIYNGKRVEIYGAKVVAANDGKVIISGNGRLEGNYVVIDHGGNITTRYLHLSKINVGVGDEVKKGEKIGEVGSTGNSTGPHLHFEISINGTRVNPMNYFN